MTRPHLTEQRSILIIGIIALLLNGLQYKAITHGNILYIIGVLIGLVAIGYSLSLSRKKNR